jgi:hypothetical protein
MARIRIGESLNQGIKGYSEGKDTQGNQEDYILHMIYKYQ